MIALQGRILIAADVHANLPAFEAVLQAAGEVDGCIFCGDIVGYGTHPLECVVLLEELSRRVPTCAILGNHDVHALERDRSWPGGPVANGSQWEEWTATRLDDAARSFLRQLPAATIVTCNGLRAHICHYQSPLSSHVDDATVAEELQRWEYREDAELVIFGHFHRQIDLKVAGMRMVNPGAIGQLRQGRPQAEFALWTPPDNISFQSVPYDVDRTVAALAEIPMTTAYRETWEINYRKGIVDLSRE